MSFDLICKGCGAPSSPSVGICPFCKTVMVSRDSKELPGLDAFVQMYHDGQIQRALSIGTELETSRMDLKNDLAFILAFAKVLIETEAPSSKIRSLLTSAYLLHPQNADLIDYLEIIEAKNMLKSGANDPGETVLKSILKRSPQNVHAHFILGAHLFWSDEQLLPAVPHLETCVRLHPNFLRAWGCLGAIYKKLGNVQLAQMAFLKCANLETNSSMKEFFIEQSRS